MKPKLTPLISYIIGIWKCRKAKEGIGITGNDDIIRAFTMSVINSGITTPDKVQIKKDKAFFYHSKYRVFFQKILKSRVETFKYENDYSASYFAGMFDSCGGYNKDKKTVYIANADTQDEMVLLRLGYKIKLIKSKLIIVDKEKFLSFINPFRKTELPEKILRGEMK
ncbi:hypothetical protein J7J90_04520 [Candidatus Micrarchaeota archaeon]|nr:hypothetical protein [Candidatus Micrarchaeota archaeon]